MKLGERIAKMSLEAAELFAEYFSSVYRDDVICTDPESSEEPAETTLNSLYIPMFKIHEKLKSLDHNFCRWSRKNNLDYLGM